MSTHHGEEVLPEVVVVDGYTLSDVCWLLSAVAEFARFADLEAVQQLVRFANPALGADGLAKIADEFASRLARRVETSPRIGASGKPRPIHLCYWPRSLRTTPLRRSMNGDSHRQRSEVKFRRGQPLGAEQEVLVGEPAGRTSTITTPPEVLVSRAGDLTP